MGKNAEQVFYLSPEAEVTQATKASSTKKLNQEQCTSWENENNGVVREALTTSTLEGYFGDSPPDSLPNNPLDLTFPEEALSDIENSTDQEELVADWDEPFTLEQPAPDLNLPDKFPLSPAATKESTDFTKGKKLELLGVESHLTSLAQLISNMAEAYSAVIFIADNDKEILRIGGAQTLSSSFKEDAVIEFGASLIGWCAESRNPISVCPFEHEATTLLYYREEQPLKSFTAVPILNEREELLGIIACDSTKSYAFSKTTEKILIDCARQAATLMELHRSLQNPPSTRRVNISALDLHLQSLRSSNSESELLKKAANMPAELIKRDALAIVTTAENGLGGAKYYSSSPSQMEHRLLDIVCKHKKIICAERKVHAMPTDDLKQRSFLSIPFSALEREAGSFNLLSRPHEAFEATEIAAVEDIASVVATRLEHLRLLEEVKSYKGLSSLLSWRQFSLLAKNRINEALEEKKSVSLVKVAFDNFDQVEEICGIEGAELVKARTERLVEQIKIGNSLACKLYNNKMLILTDCQQVDGFIHRLCAQIQRISFESLEILPKSTKPGLGDIVLSGAQFIITKLPKDGETLSELTRKCASLEKQKQNDKTSKITDKVSK